MDGVAKTHFLNSQAKRTNKSLGDLVGLTGFGIHLIEVQPGDHSTEFHRHLNEDECVYVLSGAAQLALGDKTIELAAGDFAGFPKGGAAHAMFNRGPEVLRCLVVGERLQHDIVEYPRQSQVLFRNDGRWRLAHEDSLVDPKATNHEVGKK